MWVVELVDDTRALAGADVAVEPQHRVVGLHTVPESDLECKIMCLSIHTPLENCESAIHKRRRACLLDVSDRATIR